METIEYIITGLEIKHKTSKNEKYLTDLFSQFLKVKAVIDLPENTDKKLIINNKDEIQKIVMFNLIASVEKILDTAGKPELKTEFVVTKLNFKVK